MARLLAALLALTPAIADAQQFPATMPSQTVYGRLGVTAGPGQPVPITSLLSAATTSAANRVFAGPTSGGSGAATFRSLVNGDLPSMAAGTFLGNPTGAPAAPQAFSIPNLANLSNPNATLDFLPIYDHTTGTLKYISPSQMPGTGSPLALNNVWTGTNDFQGGATFGGQPWFSVKSPAHGCGSADPTGVTDSTTAIQCHINYMSTTYSGGIVFFPPGTYLVSGGGITDPAGVWLIGAGLGASTIDVTSDSIVVTFAISGGTCPSGGHYGGLAKLSVYGYQNAAATQSAVSIGQNCNVNIEDSRLWFGAYGLKNNGVDSTIINDFICGYTGCVQSAGANWYVRDKLDKVVGSPTYGFAQAGNGGVGVLENHLSETDISCACTYSLYIDDGANNSITHFDGSVFDSPIYINHAKWVQITGSEVGSTSFTINFGTLLMTGTGAFASTTISGAGGKACAANASFTNC